MELSVENNALCSGSLGNMRIKVLFLLKYASAGSVSCVCLLNIAVQGSRKDGFSFCSNCGSYKAKITALTAQASAEEPLFSMCHPSEKHSVRTGGEQK